MAPGKPERKRPRIGTLDHVTEIARVGQSCARCAELEREIDRRRKHAELLARDLRVTNGEKNTARARVAELEAALRGMLLSADCAWELRRDGHDWAEACDAARAALAKAAAHEHRWVTDDDGAVHPCVCGAAWSALAAGNEPERQNKSRRTPHHD